MSVLDGLGNTDPVRVVRQPGEGWRYSGGGYTVMQLAISEAEQSSFPETMQEHVLEPIGMTRSTLENPLPDRFHAIAATGYRANGDEVEGKWPIYPEMAAAGLWTTPSELIKYAIEIQRILQSGRDGVLRYNTTVEMLNVDGNGYGLGPEVKEYTFGHEGADEGFRANLIAWKEQPYAAVIMVNSDNGKIIQELFLSIVNEYNLPGVEPTTKGVAEIAPDVLEGFAGKYELEEVGTIDLSVIDGGLKFYSQQSSYTTSFLPQSELEFFNVDDGSLLSFEVRDGVISGFDAWGLHAARQDTD